MRGAALDLEIRHSCRVHAKLLDAFIALTEAELERHGPGFIEESLTELLDSLRQDRRTFGTLAGVVAMPRLPLEEMGNAA